MSPGGRLNIANKEVAKAFVTEGVASACLYAYPFSQTCNLSSLSLPRRGESSDLRSVVGCGKIIM